MAPRTLSFPPGGKRGGHAAPRRCCIKPSDDLTISFDDEGDFTVVPNDAFQEPALEGHKHARDSVPQRHPARNSKQIALIFDDKDEDETYVYIVTIQDPCPNPCDS